MPRVPSSHGWKWTSKGRKLWLSINTDIFWIHFSVGPLDVMLAKSMRKLGVPK